VRRATRGWLLVAFGLVAWGLPHAADADWDPSPLGGAVTEQDHQCSARDLPETGLQGDVPRADQESGRAKLGYNCGLSLVGHTAIQKGPGTDPSPRTGNANMAWSGDCAYVAGPGSLFGPPSPEDDWGVAVVDVSNPKAPRHVRTLRTPGALASAETVHAVTTRDRAILVVGQYGNVGNTNVPMDVYDVRSCANPVLLETVHWEENTHNLTVSGNGRYVFATQPLQVVDLDPLFDGNPATPARHLGNLESAIPFPLVATGPGADLDDALPGSLSRPYVGASSLSHEAWPSDDGTRLYLGGVTAEHEVFTIVDIGAWLQRGPTGAPIGQPVVLSQRTGRGHSVRTATLRESGSTRRLVLHSEEAVFGTAYGCLPETLNPFGGPAQPWLTDVTDPTNPKLLSQFGLEINEPENCATQLDSGTNSSSHYHDVDDPNDTTFTMISMWNAGIRLFDIRHPDRPVEVAYFNPGDVGAGETVLDQAWGHIRYVKPTGQIWFATASGGFWVVELSPQLRRHLGLDGRSPVPRIEHPDGRPGTDGVARLPILPSVTTANFYCTLNTLTPSPSAPGT
jgi:hypothetical protein